MKYIILKRTSTATANTIEYEQVGEAKTLEAIQIMFGDLIMWGTAESLLTIAQVMETKTEIKVSLEV